ncbi:HBR134Cp [Eremothecium sinecaudum]|uniref:HBR134Cp n=1 Tax=Eremothecium sinecaudum TaxID=45286 RepID=A0A120K158_9SACH|nr:HBR134Cp [Eremothecium sinecaudum]AMD19035.1 HBR134Cp [Eremothecium sinecaudum]
MVLQEFHNHPESKVKVTALESLFLLSYMDPQPRPQSKLSGFNVYLYIDIPTIDFYNDEMTQGKVSRMNKRFKIQKVKKHLFASFTNFNRQLWNIFKESPSDSSRLFRVYIHSSGSLRYVESIKYLIESCWSELYEVRKQVQITFYVHVTPTTHKWFTTFLDKEIVDSDVVIFIPIKSYGEITASTNPFKEYYSKLNDKFTKKNDSSIMDSIVVVTNKTGVKALLTILCDRPLTSYLYQESLDALNNNALRSAKSGLVEGTSHDYIDSSEDDTPLTRNSSSLLNFQGSLLTSNKDKSVKVITIPIPSKNRSSRSLTPLDNDGGDSYRLVSSASLKDPVCIARRQNIDTEDFIADEDDEFEDDDQEVDSSSDEDGLSFYAPMKLSGACTTEECNTEGTVVDIHQRLSGRRFRSLSLIDPRCKPFAHHASPSMERIEDEISSQSINNEWYTNIHIQDGDFGEAITPSQGKRIRRSLRKEVSSHGLIPPSFFSRLSSPNSSSNSSQSSLFNLNLISAAISKQTKNESFELGTTSPLKRIGSYTSEKSLADSSGDSRKQSSAQLFQTLMGKDKYAGHWVGKTSPMAAGRSLYHEDHLISCVNVETDVEQKLYTSKSSSVSTIIKEGTDILPSTTLNEMHDVMTEVHLPLESNHYPDDKEVNTHNYKKPKFTLDLYSDEDINNTGAWVLGSNNR